MPATQQKISSKVVTWDMEFRGEVILEALGPALESVSWLQAVFYLGSLVSAWPWVKQKSSA